MFRFQFAYPGLIAVLLFATVGCSKPAPLATPTPTPTLSEFETHKQKGISLSQSTAWPPAIPELEKANKLHPDDPQVLYHLFRCRSKTEEFPDPSGGAYAAAKRLTQISSKSKQATEARAYIKLAQRTGLKRAGLKLVDEGKYGQAVPLLEQACKINPKDKDARFGLFLAYANTQPAVRGGRAYQAADSVRSLMAGQPEALRAGEYMHTVEAGIGGSPRASIERFVSILRHLDNPRQLAYFFPMNYNHRVKVGGAVLEQQEQARARVAQFLAQIYSNLRVVYLSQKMTGEKAVVHVRETLTDPGSGSSRTMESDIPMVREDGLWKFDASQMRH